jgi:4,5-dihydroxyphthalate decarboxylase
MDSGRLVLACDAPELALLEQGMTRFGDLEIEIQRVHPRERHKKMAESLAFDICEFSLVDYLSGFERGLHFAAIPVFPHRIFRHRDIWVSTASGIKEPKELSGRRVGIQSWTNSASVWQRGLLAQDFGVDLKSIEWVAELHREDERGRGPQWARINGKPKDRSLDQMLASGAIDAMMLPRPPELEAEAMPRIRRLFLDYVAAEQDYRRRTGILPIMHVMVIKNDLLGSVAGLADAVYRGVQSALDRFVEEQRQTNGTSVLWPRISWSEQEKHLGRHPWPAGVDANRKVLDALIGYALDQGILSKRISAEELFEREM